MPNGIKARFHCERCFSLHDKLAELGREMQSHGIYIEVDLEDEEGLISGEDLEASIMWTDHEVDPDSKDWASRHG